MNIDIDPELERYVVEKVKAGVYPSPSAAINDALAAAKAQEELTPEDVAELRELIAVSLAQAERGESKAWDAAEMKQRLRAHISRTKAS